MAVRGSVTASSVKSPSDADRGPRASPEAILMQFSKVPTMRKTLTILLLLALLPALSGCGRSLFSQNKLNTTQFEGPDRMRGHYRPRTEPDVFGTPQPALRARLTNR